MVSLGIGKHRRWFLSSLLLVGTRGDCYLKLAVLLSLYNIVLDAVVDFLKVLGCEVHIYDIIQRCFPNTKNAQEKLKCLLIIIYSVPCVFIQFVILHIMKKKLIV
jgi:hypothetical protein